MFSKSLFTTLLMLSFGLVFTACNKDKEPPTLMLTVDQSAASVGDMISADVSMEDDRDITNYYIEVVALDLEGQNNLYNFVLKSSDAEPDFEPAKSLDFTNLEYTVPEVVGSDSLVAGWTLRFYASVQDENEESVIETVDVTIE